MPVIFPYEFQLATMSNCLSDVFQEGKERQCSRYHYEAQTLERIIRAEIDLVAVKNIVTNIEEKTEKVKNEKNDELSRLAEKMDILQKKMNNLVRNISETKVAKEGSTTSSMWKFCTSCKTTCSDVENSECKWMACKCKPGLSYHHATRKCLPDCGDFGYGNTYQV
ncbi:uncharacterized protein LOC132750695 [Ruditapes philippinarum]|uniref:uncharacterized protein LOC132750695 n=1 Tax=Ruditapes philippinarum TaxID=129788 RepID=UPI00295A9507|nr:uncharacterized protein LOC132750695 [Ruditapes philippinarum]